MLVLVLAALLDEDHLIDADIGEFLEMRLLSSRSKCNTGL